MTPIITINGIDFNAYDWTERPPNGVAHERHARDIELLENGIDELGPARSIFAAIRPSPSTLLSSSRGMAAASSSSPAGPGKHVAKPY
jgi:hypothetical protein